MEDLEIYLASDFITKPLTTPSNPAAGIAAGRAGCRRRTRRHAPSRIYSGLVFVLNGIPHRAATLEVK